MTPPTTLSLADSAAKSLFLGNILEQNIFPFPGIAATERDTLSMVLDSVDKFMQANLEDYRKFDLKGEQPAEYLQQLRELGLFGLIIPEEYGGIGLSNAGYSRVLQQVSRVDASTSLTIGAHSSIGMKGLLLFGTPEQKQRYLPALASGERIAAFCLTEAGSGSDAGSIKTHAVKNPDGSWTLTGEKIWITNGSLASFFTVFARTDSASGKMTAFIVDRAWKGVSNGPKEDKLGIRSSATTTVSFDAVQVPAKNVLGEEGHGFKIAMAILNNGRTGLGGGCVGAMKALIQHALRQASERKQFGKPIASFQLIQDKIAQMTVLCFAAESIVQMVAHYIDSGVQDFSVEAAMSKVFATEALWSVAYEALQIAGGNGFMREYPYERVLRDSRINMIFEGTNEILRLYVALSGMKDAGEYLKDLRRGVGKIFNDPIKGFGVLSGYVTRKVTQLTPLGRDRLETLAPELREQAAVFELYTPRLARAVETILMRMGSNILGQQLISRRVADVSIDLFVGLCILSRVQALVEKQGAAACSDELAIARLFAQNAKRRMNFNLRRLVSNEDQEVISLATSMLKHGSFRWDVL